MNEKKFLGLQYPVVKTPQGYFAQKHGTSQIKADLLQLLLTHPGERVMLPEFGTPLKNLLFEPADVSLEEAATQVIAKAIETWEPRIIINNIEVQAGVSEEYQTDPDFDATESDKVLMISIEFIDPDNISEIDKLVLQIPI